ncbi:MAG: peptide deformylase [Bacteroidia bacterium]
MALPIVAYGDPVLKKKAIDVSPDYPKLKQLIEDMFTTMDEAEGVGLAAPQVGISIRLFVTDAGKMTDEEKQDRRVFINPEIIEEIGEDRSFEEGCLSIPGIREIVKRPEAILIEYYDENFKKHQAEFDDLLGRIIQHEYDHVEGILFTDRIPAFKRTLLKRKLNAITKGIVPAKYKMRFPKKK